MKVKLLLLMLLLNTIQSKSQDKPCKPRNYGYDSVACVCDKHYCDSANPQPPECGRYLHVVTNKAGHRFQYSYGNYSQQHSKNNEFNCLNIINNKSVILTVDRQKKGQTIIGFGTAFTDAAGINLNSVSQNLRDQIINSYFGKEGLRYNMARTTIGHCDFSTEPYYHDETEYDVELKNWTLHSTDVNHKIPYIKQAMSASTDELYLITSIWTVPKWMRQENYDGIKNQVQPKYYGTMTLFIIKFLEAYREKGIEFWGVNYVNEPTVNVGVEIYEGSEEVFTSWTIKRLAEYATEHFIPAMQKNFSNVKILHFDDNRNILISNYFRYMKTKTNLPKYLKYVALHSYSNSFIGTSVVETLKSSFPNVTIISSEFCAGQGLGVQLGAWSTAEYYATNIIEELNTYSSAWIDWNLALNLDSGPHFSGTPVDAPIAVDAEKDEFYKQPSYYVMGHFSKFMPRGSVYVSLTSSFPTNLRYGAVLRPDGLVSTVVYNPTSAPVSVTIKDEEKEIDVIVTAHSINSILF
ncbi:lysosomal acid glucosylceramidase [Plutella xylostella]|uniref:lysosomal acid glucosylceramidase n=1 Tax=Plutella xylostella TaxID=51655 RepID=UPI002032699A|nr:lysosomal acid glucosylceramidase [Plutella xylostella]